MQEEMAVTLDHPGHQGRSREVHNPRIGRRREIWANSGDALAFHEHLPARVKLTVQSVEDRGGLEQDGTRRGLRRRCREFFRSTVR